MNSDFMKERIAELEAQAAQEAAEGRKHYGGHSMAEELPTEQEVRAALGQDNNVALHGGGGTLRCYICDAPSGEVQLVKVTSTDFGVSGYVCKGGDCAGQRNKAVQRLVSQKMQRTERLLRMVEQRKPDPAVAARKARSKKTARKQSQASKRANRR